MSATSGAETAYPSGAHEFTLVFSGVRVARSSVSCVVFCRSLFVLLSFFFWPLCCLYFDLRILNTHFGILKLFLLVISCNIAITLFYLFIAVGNISINNIKKGLLCIIMHAGKFNWQHQKTNFAAVWFLYHLFLSPVICNWQRKHNNSNV
jgi:hypothetical protein